MMPMLLRIAASSSTTRMRSAMGGQRDPEAGAAAHHALDVDLSPVVIDDPPHDGEPQAGTARSPRVERLEDVAERLGRDSAPGVANRDLHAGGDAPGLDREGAAVTHRLRGVHEDVP